MIDLMTQDTSVLGCFSSETELPPATAAPSSVVSSSRSAIVGSFANACLSREERKYVEEGICQSYRIDGRALLDYRPVTVEVNVLPSCCGSSRVRTADTELVVGIKCEIQRIRGSDLPNIGIVQCSVDCSPSFDLETQGRGGEDAARYISQLIEMLCLGPNAINRQDLCVVPGEFVWKVFVDTVILNGKGNLLDAVSIGIRAALLNTLLPNVTHHREIDQETGEETFNFELDQRVEMGRRFPATKVPICVTVGQIRSRFVWDLRPEEEACSVIRLTIAIDSEGLCCGIHKAGESTIGKESTLIAIQNSCRIGQIINNRLLGQYE